MHIEWTLGPAIAHNTYHIPLVRGQLTRNIGALFPEIRDEIVAAFGDAIPAGDGTRNYSTYQAHCLIAIVAGWVKVTALNTMMQVVGRVSNRVFVGLPTCVSQSLPTYGKLSEYHVFRQRPGLYRVKR